VQHGLQAQGGHGGPRAHPHRTGEQQENVVI
jgi:hypothetical protein